MHQVLRTSALYLAAFLPLASHAQPHGEAADNAADKAAIQAIIQNEQDAWNRGDAQAFCSHFAADGSFTNIVGMQTYGYAPFLKQHERIFGTIYKGSHNVLALGTLRFLRPDVAVADVDSTLSHIVSAPPGTPLFPDGSIHTKLQLVLTRQNGTWQVDAFHNVTVNPHIADGGPPQ